MTDGQFTVELVLAIAVAVAVVRYWRQLMALVVAALVALCALGLLTVLTWLEHWPQH